MLKQPKKQAKITIKGKRVKIPTFLPQGKHKHSKKALALAYDKQQRWIQKNQSAHGKAMAKSWATGDRKPYTGGPGKVSDETIPMNGHKTELNFLEGMFKRKSLWNYGSTLKLVELLQKGWRIEQIAKKFNLQPASVKNMVQELKRANREGYTLEDYFRKDRPCRYGKKVLA
jgi:hypothetical protein